MKRFLLLFLTAPTIVITALGLVTPALAAGVGKPNPNQKFCINAHARLVCVKSSQIASTKTNATLIAKAQAEAKNPDAFINFNDEESDGAIALFGCDCPACIRSLRQLRVMAKVS
jgi:hypothetical protein